MLGVVGAFAAEPVRVTGRTMGTTWAVSYTAGAGAESPEIERVRLRVQARLDELEEIFSTYRAGSEVSRFNRAASGEWVSVSAELAEVAEISRGISALTGGAFDATVAPLVELWGFGPHGVARAAAWPTAEEIAGARMRVGFRRLEVRREPAAALRKVRGDVAVDFSSVAKGFATDEVARVLREMGAPEHLVQVAGDMRSGGAKRWRVGIEAPEGRAGGEGEIADVVELGGGEALSTSGNYRNVIVREGRRVGHIIDPRIGRPVESEVVAVSVVAKSSAEASGWATGLFVLGVEEGMRVADREGIAVMFLVRNGDGFTRRMTAGFERVVR